MKYDVNSKTLKREFLDNQCSTFDRSTLDAIARMLWEIDDPSTLLELVTEHLSCKYGGCRTDIGLSSSKDLYWVPEAIYIDPNIDAPSTIGEQLPNQHQIMQNIWNSDLPIVYEDIANNGEVVDFKPALTRLKCKSSLLKSLKSAENPNNKIGLICVDETRADREWLANEKEFLHLFCDKIASPLIEISFSRQAMLSADYPFKPSSAELCAIRLLADGNSCKAIAKQLDKSVRTIEHQIRNAKQKLDARNQAELVRKCQMWM